MDALAVTSSTSKFCFAHEINFIFPQKNDISLHFSFLKSFLKCASGLLSYTGIVDGTKSTRLILFLSGIFLFFLNIFIRYLVRYKLYNEDLIF